MDPESLWLAGILKRDWIDNHGIGMGGKKRLGSEHPKKGIDPSGRCGENLGLMLSDLPTSQMRLQRQDVQRHIQTSPPD